MSLVNTDEISISILMPVVYNDEIRTGNLMLYSFIYIF